MSLWLLLIAQRYDKKIKIPKINYKKQESVDKYYKFYYLIRYSTYTGIGVCHPIME